MEKNNLKAILNQFIGVRSKKYTLAFAAMAAVLCVHSVITSTQMNKELEMLSQTVTSAQQSYEILNADYANLQSEYKALKTDYHSLIANHGELEINYEKLSNSTQEAETIKKTARSIDMYSVDAETESNATEQEESEEFDSSENENIEVDTNGIADEEADAINNSELDREIGVNYFNGHKETYYNLNMAGVISIAKYKGIIDKYWVRNDGVKMYGEYVMVAADYSVHEYGSIVETSLGTGIVLDTGDLEPNQFDIAVNW